MSAPNLAVPYNLETIESAYQRWQADPLSVDATWRAFFEGFTLAANGAAPGRIVASAGSADAAPVGVFELIDSYRELGHLLAHLDPLSDPPPTHPLLELSEFDLSDADLDRTFDGLNFIGLPRANLRDLIAALRETYCVTIGVEYMHIQDTRVRKWLEERMEPRRNRPNLPLRQKLRVLMNLHYAELFERFLHTRYVGQKRFSLEGAETLIPVLDALVEKAPELGVQEIIIGMAHRGRLNVLANILHKPYQEIFSEFEDNYLPDSIDGDGDVKYHLGFSHDHVTATGRRVHLSLTPNPSHLEAVNPVVEGRTRAKQKLFGDKERKRGLPLLIHGDAAFAGQGLVAETLNLAHLKGYRTGGTVHVIVNNQIGFTTSPADARSTTYCTDVAKMIEAPVFHVNAEDPEAAVYLTELALEFRQNFGQDVVIDMVCFRRHGHNEGDEPSFTQPVMYAKIKNRPSVAQVYTDQLVREGSLKPEEAKALAEEFQTKLNTAQTEVRAKPPNKRGMRGFAGQWSDFQPRYRHDPVETAVAATVLADLARTLTQVPDGFSANPKVLRMLEQRRADILDQRAIDWATGEMLAFATLLQEGTSIRLSGQDSRRGTFSQRHAVLFDTRTGEPFVPLNQVAGESTEFTVYDSMLSEAAVLGFEFGYSLDAPGSLVMWEAQFGDFVNGAQVIIDQFLVCSESKWQRASGLVLLLPHGYEGQGPEHSSARLERFLQACADDNIQVCNLTTPAQYFHVLRRQVKRDFRKPLIIMTPKSLLRHKAAVSTVSDFTDQRFEEIIDDTTATPEAVRRVLLCSGKVYYDLLEKRTERESADVAIVRLEQLYPLDEEQLKRAVGRYRRAKELVWVQEESQNMGAWSYIEPRLRALGWSPTYVGRDASASPATGSLRVHLREQQELVEAALTGPVPHLVRATPAPTRKVSAVNEDTIPVMSKG